MSGETMVASTPLASSRADDATSDDACVASASASAPASVPTPARTPATARARLSFSTPATTPVAPKSAVKTPASGLKVPGHGDMCAVCYSPLDREGRCDPDVEDVKRELFTTECGHVFHRCCLVRCREADFSTCPMCRAALPSGLTPEHVREKRAAQRLADQANVRRDAVIGAAARAREAVRAQYVRRMINRPVGAGPAVPNTISEEDDEDAASAGEMPPWMSPPRHRNRAGSAPATPARVGSESSLPVMRGGGGSNVATPASTARAPAEGAFVTAAEELRARAAASAVAVAAAYATASAPSTPTRSRDVGADTTGAESVGVRASVGTVSSLVRDAARGAGNAATLDGWDAAEEDRDARARAAEAELGAVALALGGMGGDDWGEDETTPDSESESATFATSFAAPFRSAKVELAATGAAAACATRALVVNGTASAPATPMHHRPAVAAAMTAAEEAAAAGDEDARRRADAVVRRLLADEDP